MREKLRATFFVLAVISPIASLIATVVTMREERLLCQASTEPSGDGEADALPALQRVFLLK